MTYREIDGMDWCDEKTGTEWLKPHIYFSVCHPF
jgi:hypothetical protein